MTRHRKLLIVAFAFLTLTAAACESSEEGLSAGEPVPMPIPVCGNDMTEAGESCDGTDLNGFTCASLSAELTSGTLACRSDCLGYDISLCQAEGRTIQASSCEQEDVQAAVDEAEDGDRVSVPAGQCTWTSPAGCDGREDCAPVAIIRKAVSLVGAGAGSTIIESNVPEGWQYATLFVESQEGLPFRVSGFTITEIIAPAISVNGTSRSWRIDNCDVQPASGDGVTAIEITGGAYGVIDHSTFLNAEIIVLADEDDAWNRPLSLGTADAVYIEDCSFDNSGPIDDVVDGRSGARFVFRYNTLTNMELHCHGIEGGGYRGTYGYEFYGNAALCDGSINCYRMAYLRGGTGVMFDNTWTGDWSVTGLQLVHQCVYREECEGFKACGRYPCHDQIGRTTDHDGNGVQDLVPLFEWNNTRNGEDIDFVVQNDVHPEMDRYIQEGRDFYNDAVIFNSETDTFDATYLDDGGVTRAFRYVPYVYPHPLVQIELDLTGP